MMRLQPPRSPSNDSDNRMRPGSTPPLTGEQDHHYDTSQLFLLEAELPVKAFPPKVASVTGRGSDVVSSLSGPCPAPVPTRPTLTRDAARAAPGRLGPDRRAPGPRGRRAELSVTWQLARPHNPHWTHHATDVRKKSGSD